MIFEMSPCYLISLIFLQVHCKAIPLPEDYAKWKTVAEFEGPGPSLLDARPRGKPQYIKEFPNIEFHELPTTSYKMPIVDQHGYRPHRVPQRYQSWEDHSHPRYFPLTEYRGTELAHGPWTAAKEQPISEFHPGQDVYPNFQGPQEPRRYALQPQVPDKERHYPKRWQTQPDQETDYSSVHFKTYWPAKEDKNNYKDCPNDQCDETETTTQKPLEVPWPTYKSQDEYDVVLYENAGEPGYKPTTSKIPDRKEDMTGSEEYSAQSSNEHTEINDYPKPVEGPSEYPKAPETQSTEDESSNHSQDNGPESNHTPSGPTEETNRTNETSIQGVIETGKIDHPAAYTPENTEGGYPEINIPMDKTERGENYKGTSYLAGTIGTIGSIASIGAVGFLGGTDSEDKERPLIPKPSEFGTEPLGIEEEPKKTSDEKPMTFEGTDLDKDKGASSDKDRDTYLDKNKDTDIDTEKGTDLNKDKNTDLDTDKDTDLDKDKDSYDTSEEAHKEYPTIPKPTEEAYTQNVVNLNEYFDKKLHVYKDTHSASGQAFQIFMDDGPEKYLLFPEDIEGTSSPNGVPDKSTLSNENTGMDEEKVNDNILVDTPDNYPQFTRLYNEAPSKSDDKPSGKDPSTNQGTENEIPIFTKPSEETMSLDEDKPSELADKLNGTDDIETEKKEDVSIDTPEKYSLFKKPSEDTPSQDKDIPNEYIDKKLLTNEVGETDDDLSVDATEKYPLFVKPSEESEDQPNEYTDKNPLTNEGAADKGEEKIEDNVSVDTPEKYPLFMKPSEETQSESESKPNDKKPITNDGAEADEETMESAASVETPEKYPLFVKPSEESPSEDDDQPNDYSEKNPLTNGGAGDKGEEKIEDDVSVDTPEKYPLFMKPSEETQSESESEPNDKKPITNDGAEADEETMESAASVETPEKYPLFIKPSEESPSEDDDQPNDYSDKNPLTNEGAVDNDEENMETDTSVNIPEKYPLFSKPTEDISSPDDDKPNEDSDKNHSTNGGGTDADDIKLDIDASADTSEKYLLFTMPSEGTISPDEAKPNDDEPQTNDDGEVDGDKMETNASTDIPIFIKPSDETTPESENYFDENTALEYLKPGEDNNPQPENFSMYEGETSQEIPDLEESSTTEQEYVRPGEEPEYPQANNSTPSDNQGPLNEEITISEEELPTYDETFTNEQENVRPDVEYDVPQSENSGPNKNPSSPPHEDNTFPEGGNDTFLENPNSEETSTTEQENVAPEEFSPPNENSSSPTDEDNTRPEYGSNFPAPSNDDQASNTEQENLEPAPENEVPQSENSQPNADQSPVTEKNNTTPSNENNLAGPSPQNLNSNSSNGQGDMNSEQYLNQNDNQTAQTNTSETNGDDPSDETRSDHSNGAKFIVANYLYQDNKKTFDIKSLSDAEHLVVPVYEQNVNTAPVYSTAAPSTKGNSSLAAIFSVEEASSTLFNKVLDFEAGNATSPSNSTEDTKPREQTTDDDYVTYIEYEEEIDSSEYDESNEEPKPSSPDDALLQGLQKMYY